MSDPFRTRERREHLIVPCQPTPNGRLHLGHMAGPFLRADILARTLRRAGQGVTMISGSDSYESHVLWRATLDGAAPASVAHRYHTLMGADLAALEIGCEEWIEPIDPAWAPLYERVHRTHADDLRARGNLVSRVESVAYGPTTGRFIAGCWVKGRCPYCGAGVGGYHCEVCGGHFRPEEITDATPRFPEPSLERRDIESLYVRADAAAVREAVERTCSEAFFRDIAMRHLAREGPLVRFTAPGDWGLRYPEGSHHVFYTYTGLFAYGLVCAEVAKKHRGWSHAPFSLSSDVRTIATFGIDNTIPYLLGTVIAALGHGAAKPFDHLLPNHFLDLDGAKFSTSLGHVIWARDLVTLTPVTSDIARYCTALVSPEETGTNLDVDAFARSANALSAALAQVDARATKEMATEQATSAAPEALVRELGTLILEQERAVSPEVLAIHRATAPIDQWLTRLERTPTSELGWWLKGLATLAAPIMPAMGRGLWASSGHEGEPRLDEFLERLPMKAPARLATMPHITRASLQPALPKGPDA